MSAYSLTDVLFTIPHSPAGGCDPPSHRTVLAFRISGLYVAKFRFIQLVSYLGYIWVIFGLLPVPPTHTILFLRLLRNIQTTRDPLRAAGRRLRGSTSRRPAPAASANALLRLRADRRATRCTVAAVQAPNPRERRCSAPQGATVGVLAPPLLCRREPLLCRWSRTRV